MRNRGRDRRQRTGEIMTPELCAIMLREYIWAWYDAKPENVTLVSGMLSGLRDLTGRGNNGVQATEGNRLTYFPQDPMFGMRPSFGATASTGSKHIASPSLAVRHVFQTVYYKDGVDTTFDVYSYFISGTGLNGSARVMGNQGTADLISSSYYASVGYKNGILTSSATMLPLPASVCRFDGNTTQVFQTGGSSVTSGRVFVGGFNGVVLCKLLDRYKIQLVEGVLAWAAGTQFRLVAGHPYKLRPPMVGD